MGTLHRKRKKCSKQLSVTTSWEKHGLLIGFFDSNVKKLQLKVVIFKVVPPQAAQTKLCRRSEKLSTKTDEGPCRRSLEG